MSPVQGLDVPPPLSRMPSVAPARPPARVVAVVGAGPAGLTAALLLARAGHAVTVYEAGASAGGLWAAQLDPEGRYISENSCKVYQPTYHSAPALLRLLGTRWEEHFTPHHDLTRDWLRPFVADCSAADLAQFAGAFVRNASGLQSYRDVSVAEWLTSHSISERGQAWMRATALGGIAGTLRMTMWELFHRLGGNLGSILSGGGSSLYWNTRPPNAPGGFISIWLEKLEGLGVPVRTACRVESLRPVATGVQLTLQNGSFADVDAVFLAIAPRALAQLLRASDPAVSRGFTPGVTPLDTVLAESLYEHLGVAWYFDRPLPRPLPLGGHNVRTGWHPILVEHAQYRDHLPPPAVTAVVGSVSLATDLVHPRLGTRAREHSLDALASILWEDERRIAPDLPEPVGHAVYGLSDATQVVHHGALPVQAGAAPIYLATSLNGRSAYFTASLESAIQAGAAAALAYDPRVERLPVGPSRRAGIFRSEVLEQAS